MNEQRITLLRSRGLSLRSARVYEGHLSRLEAFLEPRGAVLSTVDVEHLSAYVEVLPRSHSGLTQLRASLRHYFDAIDRRDAPLWVIRPPHKPPARCKAIEPDEAARLERVARARGDEKGLAVLLGLYAALRRAEIAALRWENLDETSIRVLGKGDRTRYVPIHPELAEVLAPFRQPAGPIFPGQRGRVTVSPATVWDWVRQVAEEAGIPAFRTHQLRHTCLATANDATGDLRAVQELAGHAKPETTAGYTRVLRRRLAATVEAISYGPDHADPARKDGAKPAALGYRRVVTALGGWPQETELWCELAVLLQDRPGWRFEIANDYAPVMSWAFGSDVSVGVLSLRDRPAWLTLSRQEGPGDWDFLCWDFPDVEGLAQVLEAFEAGEPLPAPPSWFPGQDGGLRAVGSG
ncbi:MAG TPA: tyrosine-type recombinase/integrase [Acidimicrobiales bacterium]|nr:tyrosine-type recombinase/integrase [Acidimicrobiales bacterium]